MPISILLADDCASVRMGLRMLLELDEDFCVVGEAPNGSVAVRLAQELAPDVILMDVRMPIMDGLTATAQISCTVPGTRILLLSSSSSPTLAAMGERAGAAGSVSKDGCPDALVAAIKQAVGVS